MLDKTTSWLSKELNTKVEIGEIDIDFFDQILLKNIFIEDLKNDTLLYADLVKADIALFSFLNNKLFIEDIELENVQVNVKRLKSEENFNFNFILDYFAGDGEEQESTKKSKNWLLGLNELNLDKLKLNIEDEHKGEIFDINLKSGNLVFDKIVQDSVLVAAKSAKLDQLVFKFTKNERGVPYQEITIQEGTSSSSDSIKKVLQFKVADFKLTNSFFTYDDNRRARSELDGIDFPHLVVDDIGININGFQFLDGDFSGDVTKLTAKEKSGFQIKNLVGEAFVNNRKIQVNNVKLTTPNSTIGDTIVLKYRGYADFWEFVDNVKLESELNNATVGVTDILAFAPKLANTKFFRENASQVLLLDGSFKGQINKLKGKDIAISLNNTKLEGSFRTRDLTNPEETFLDIKVSKFTSSIAEIKKLIPSAKVPRNFSKLGQFDFSGNFTGFLKDFVADGELTSELGRVRSDLQIQLKDGVENSIYSGNLEVFDFDVATWADNPIFGKASFKTQVKGTGITANTVTANLDALVKDFEFKGYNYQNVALDGVFERKKFEGILKVAEENLNLSFDGTIDFNDSLPVFDLEASIKELDLYALNLMKQQYAVKGDAKLNFSGNNLDNFAGVASIYGLDVIKDEKSYKVDSITLESIILGQGNKKLELRSEIVTAEIKGDFDIVQMPNAIAKFIEVNYPDWADKARIQSFMFVQDTIWTGGTYDIVQKPITPKNQAFEFKVNIHKTNNLTELLVKDVQEIENASFKGRFNSLNNTLVLGGKVPKVIVKNLTFKDVMLTSNNFGSTADIRLQIGQTLISDSLRLPPINLKGDLANDTLQFGLDVENITDVVKNVNVNGILFPTVDYFQASLLPSDLLVFNNKWDISGDNYIQFGQNYINTKNVVLNHENERISLNSTGEKGLLLSLDNINLKLVNELINVKNLNVNGILYSTIEVKDVYKLQDIELKTKIAGLKINEDDWGSVHVLASSNSFNEPIDAEVKLVDGGNNIIATGQYTPPYATKDESKINFFDFDVVAEHYNIKVAEYFLKKEISNTIGKFDADVRFHGTPKNPNIGGEIRIYETSVTINYLQTRYFLDDVVAKVTNYGFDVTGNRVRDYFGNYAYATGAIVHNKLKNFGLDIKIETEKFLFLNTEKEDNPDYYGVGIGSGSVHFTGPFSQINIDAIATSGENTKITIPLMDENSAKEVSFIEFVVRDTTEDKQVTEKTSIRGVNVDLKFSVTPQADILLVFDEQAGDIIRGNGSGDINIKSTRTGEFTINGNYEIEKGDYLFTYQNFINKPFAVKPGGTIYWNGDPYDAQINIDAYYKGVRVPPYNFIQEYLSGLGTTSEIYRLARQNTSVNLLMKLEGSLLKPDINFDIEFPDVDTQLKSYVDSKLTTIRENNSELNRQVFALIVLGNFIPQQDNFSAATDTYITGINTLSELISNQLSIYLTDLLSDVVGDIGFISSIDFDVNYRLYQIQGIDGVDFSSSTSNQIQLGLKNNFLNDRLSVSIGGNIDVNTTNYVDPAVGAQSGSYIAGDFVIEYLLTPDGRYKIRAYNRSEPSTTDIDDRSNRTGLGLTYRKQFDTFAEFFESFKKDVNKQKSKRSKNRKNKPNMEKSTLGRNDMFKDQIPQ